MDSERMFCYHCMEIGTLEHVDSSIELDYVDGGYITYWLDEYLCNKCGGKIELDDDYEFTPE